MIRQRSIQKSMKKKNESETATFKVPEAAKYAGCGSSAIRRGIREGRIPHIRFGRNIFIPKIAFARWLENCGAGK
jgi:excisionase family DNA binding protein